VRVAVPASLPQALGQEPASECLDADVQPLSGELLAGQGGTEVGVTRAVGLENLPAKGGVVTVVGGFATQPVDNSGIAAFELALDASDLTDSSLEESGGLGPGSLAVENSLHHLEDVTLTLAHLHTVPVLYLDHLVPPSA
jgi:hypothetical protein